VRDLRILDTLVRDIGPDAISLLSEARVAIVAWQLEEDLFTAAAASGGAVHGIESSATRTPRWKAVETALSKVQVLDDTLAYRSNLELEEIALLEHLNGLVPVALVPLALLALAAVGWAARGTRKLSREASQGRQVAERALAAKSALMRGEGVLRVELHRTDIAALVRDVVDDYRASGSAAGVTLQFAGSTQAGELPSSRSRIQSACARC
jgi:hypothetical protein